MKSNPSRQQNVDPMDFHQINDLIQLKCRYFSGWVDLIGPFWMRLSCLNFLGGCLI